MVADTLDSLERGAVEVDVWGASLSDMQVSVLLDAVLKRRGCIRSVDLGRNTIGEEALESLEQLLSLSDVQEMKLSGNSIGDEALLRISCALTRANSSLTHLSLEANCLTDTGVSELCHSMRADACQSLTSLNLANNKLTARCAHTLLAALADSGCMLQHLNLRRNILGDDGMRAVASHLQRHTCYMQSLDISANNIGNQGVAAMGEGLREQVIILTIMPSSKTAIKVTCGLTFENVQKRPLTTMNLHGNVFNVDGVRALAQGLVTNTTFKLITLTGADAPLDVQHFRSSKLVTLRAMHVINAAFVSEILKFNLNLTKLDRCTLVVSQ
jgi:Ran GTPase-activating protein (RanGAP) involved in mRNA processing and transport